MKSELLLLSNTYRVLITFVFIGVLYALRIIINKLINARVTGLKKRYIYRQFNNYLLLGITFTTVIIFWLEWFQSILTVLSIAIAAIIVISKDFILNLIANGVIITRELFEAGDRIQIGENAGDVIETGPMFFTLSEIGKWSISDDPTGRVIKIPNSLVLTQPLANYSRGVSLLWDEIHLDLTVDSNWKKAKGIAQVIADKYSYKITQKEIKELQKNSEEVMFVQTKASTMINLKENKLILTVRFICKYHKRNSTGQQITEELLDALMVEDDILLTGSSKRET